MMTVLQVLLAGGSSEYCANPDTPASQTSYLIDVSPGAEHTIEEEALAYPRIVRLDPYLCLLDPLHQSGEVNRPLFVLVFTKLNMGRNPYRLAKWRLHSSALCKTQPVTWPSLYLTICVCLVSRQSLQKCDGIEQRII